MAHSTAQRVDLTVFRNDDTGLERPFLISVPASVDTLAELCQYLTTTIPLQGSEKDAPRGYRFLYSLHGKPLWRVKECVEARVIVVSVGPGFQPRRPQALADAAFEAITASSAPPPRAATPPNAAAAALSTSSVGDSPSGASPPVRQPANQTSHANRTAVYSAESTSPLPKAGAHDTATEAVVEDDLQGRLSALSYSGFPTTASSERAAQYRVSITRPRGGSGDAKHPTDEEVHAAAPRTSTRLFTTTPSEEAVNDVAQASPAVSVGRAVLSHAKSADSSVAGGRSRSSSSGNAPSTAAARGQFFVSGRTYELPPAPVFLSRDISDQLVEYVEDDVAFINRLRLLLARKVVAAGELKRRDEREVLCRTVFSSLQERIMDQLTPQCGRSVCRVIVEGPARSGVSSTVALLADACLNDFARHRQFFNHLLLPLDFTAVLGAASERGPSSTSPLDIPLLFSVVLGALMDAVAVQRPALRQHSVLLFELWEKLLTMRQGTTPPDFLAYHQVVSLVGFKVVSRWNALAQRVFPLLQAACADPTCRSLRDAALDVVVYAIPAEVAASLRFGGLLFCLDGLEHLCEGVAGPSSSLHGGRPSHADLAATLKALWDDAHVNVLLAWPPVVPADRVFLPFTTRRVQTIGLLGLSPQEAAVAGLPQRIDVADGRQTYNLATFLGAPGYVAQLLPLIRPRLLKTQLPTTAFSNAYQAIKREQQEKPFVLRLDDADAAAALEEFHRTARAAA